MDFGGVFAKSETELAREQLELVPFYLSATGGVLPPAAPGPELAGGWMARAQFFSMGRWHDYRAALKVVSAPALVLHGAKDLQPASASRAYVVALPNAKLVVIPGAGHFPQIEAPEALSKAVAEFLAGAA
jgi:pimeloyl-ACP methyl ester carboxylesterase